MNSVAAQLKSFRGSLVALVTPMKLDGRIDYPAFERLLDLHCENGTDGVVIAGTTGESSTLDRVEFGKLLSCAVAKVGGRIPVIAGPGTNDTATTIARSQIAEKSGVDGLLVVTPYYNRPGQRGLCAHFEAVADSVCVPVVLYNVPFRTGVDLLPESVGRLRNVPGITGIKEALNDPERLARLLEFSGDDFTILSGDDDSAADALALGCHGVISVVANLVPRRFSGLCHAALDGKIDEMRQAMAEIMPLIKVLGVESNPTPVKWALHEMGLISVGIRLPLTWLDIKNEEKIRALMRILGLKTRDSQ